MNTLGNENIIYKKQGDIEYIQFKKLLEYSNIINHAYSIGVKENYRTSDNIVEDTGLKNYKKLCSAIDTDYINLAKPCQAHTDNVKAIQSKINKYIPDVIEYQATDGLTTNSKNIILATTNADCILLLFFDPVKKVIANTHSGWKGTLQRISIKTIKKMNEEYNCNPKDIICCMCPSIRKCHFEVGDDVAKMFKDEFKDIKNFMDINKETQKWHIDTIEINKQILSNVGLKPENIIDSGICSVCNKDKIHSFRVEGKGYGLETAIIELK